MRLVVGLGNPGSRYTGQRHNIGFMAVDELHRHFSLGPWRKRFDGVTAEGEIGGERVLCLKPATFMNESGRSVLAAMQFFKLDPSALVVLHDEIDLPLGKVRMKLGGGAGGHNGLRSIDALLGPDYWRIRLGVGHPGEKELVRNFVLMDFDSDERPQVEKIVQACAEALPLFFARGENEFMNRVTVTLNPPPKREKQTKDDSEDKPDKT
jgi:peptidyl-tRNA hydrolase, PTH1 family